MKHLAVLTISLLTALSVGGSMTSAFAEENQTEYPQNGDFVKTLTFSDLTDFAVDDGTYYFADGEIFYEYGNFTLEESQLAESGYEFTPAQTNVTIGNYAFNLTDKKLKVADFGGGEEIITFDGEYSCLKEFDGKAYAIKNNSLYSFNGAEEPKEILLEYFDYSVTQQIRIGQTAEALKSYQTLKFVTLKAGTHMTAIDLTSLEGEYFKLYNTEDDVSENTVVLEEDLTALLLCYTGNAAVIAIGDISYILLNDSSTLEEKESVDCYKEAGITNATIIGNRIYASPFTVIGTTSLANATGTIVTVKNKIEYADVLNSVYYEVEYTAEDGTVKTGYVAEGFLTGFIIEDNKEPDTIPDPDHSEKTSVTTVLLIFAVVVLVLVAIGYVIYSSTSDKKKGKGKKEDEEKQEAKS